MTPQAVLAAHVTEEADPVRKYRDQVSVEVDALLAKCLAKKPADRFATPAELAPIVDAYRTQRDGERFAHLAANPAG